MAEGKEAALGDRLINFNSLQTLRYLFENFKNLIFLDFFVGCFMYTIVLIFSAVEEQGVFYFSSCPVFVFKSVDNK